MESSPIHELRLDSRNNIFVMAALYANGRSVTPVRVRNISRTGALVEAAALPAIGTAVRLSRASLSAAGTLVWAEGSKAGVQFDEPILVANWLPQGRRGIGQQFVDELFHQKRLGVVADKAQPQGGNGYGVAEELLELRLLLESAGEELAIDGMIATRHTVALQAIDGVAQALARIAAEATVHEATVTAAASA
ncbi:MAG TPA: PilZ domain-containing protein [Sphingomicrobium sp.]